MIYFLQFTILNGLSQEFRRLFNTDSIFKNFQDCIKLLKFRKGLGLVLWSRQTRFFRGYSRAAYRITLIFWQLLYGIYSKLCPSGNYYWLIIMSNLKVKSQCLSQTAQIHFIFILINFSSQKSCLYKALPCYQGRYDITSGKFCESAVGIRA